MRARLMTAGIAAWCAVAAPSVHAADEAPSIYTCRDQTGKTITADRPITGCAGVMRELGRSGIVKREIGPALSPEQQQKKDADDRARRLAEESARERHRRDLALLTAYQSADQIEAARRRSLADAEASVKQSQDRLVELQKERMQLEKDGEFYRGKTVPPLFQRKLDDNQALINDEVASIKTRQADAGRVNQRYDDDLKRYRELTEKK